VVASGGEVSRGQAAEAAGVTRGLAAFHLDKLVEAGVLGGGLRRVGGGRGPASHRAKLGEGGLRGVSFRRLGERRGPGAGRPAKLYRRAAGEVAATLPPRPYETAPHLLAESVGHTG